MPLDLRAAAVRLGGEVVSGAISCPGPGHVAPSDRSLRVYPDWQSPSGWRTHSFAGDDWNVCQEHVSLKLGLPSWRSGERNVAPAPVALPVVQKQKCDNSEYARRIFTEARPLAGTIGETYLTRRVGKVLAWPDDIRFHSRCPRRFQERWERLPAVVARLRDIRTNEPCGIQRIYLLPDGSDRLRDQMGKASLGRTAGAVIKLSPDAEAPAGLGLAEGVETALAIIAHGWAPVWATLGTAGMASFPVLSGIESLTVFSDNDTNGAGRRAAATVAKRWADAGREAMIREPKTSDSDWASTLKDAA